MIFGNPSKIAIQIELISEWCSPNFREGIFCVYLNRQRLSPSYVYADTLTVATRQLLNGLETNSMRCGEPLLLPTNLTGMSDKELFNELYKLTYPTDATDLMVDNCWDFVISPDVMTDRGFHLFIYKSGLTEVLLGGSTDTESVVSMSMPMGTTLAIAKQANSYVLSFASVS